MTLHLKRWQCPIHNGSIQHSSDPNKILPFFKPSVSFSQYPLNLGCKKVTLCEKPQFKKIFCLREIIDFSFFHKFLKERLKFLK